MSFLAAIVVAFLLVVFVKNHRAKENRKSIVNYLERWAASEVDEVSSSLTEAIEINDDVKFFSLISTVVESVLIERFIAGNFESLRKDYKRLVKVDSYGIEDSKRWFKKLSEIVDELIYDDYSSILHSCAGKCDSLKVFMDADKTELKETQSSLLEALDSYFRIELNYRLELESIDNEGLGIESDEHFEVIEDGYDYEFKVAEFINASESIWDAEVTQGSGDQGVDVVVEGQSGVTIAIQCKYYEQPVGNKAVQEAYAGRAFIDADFAFVVTNSTFTNSAIELSDKIGVKLIHHDDLIAELRAI
ncbi:restriction endonuclease [Vibrio crassostreae]|uniref:restriction endonuclease n=1 Tax=Vibrio crassostreae TaxID=246167 RepID=UPI001046EC4F|nr:restriction endonuclease [Vibrio crassostreae]TCT78879.1 restriction endonuclease [Vibrio crassostreae]CAK1878901.1 restriction system protein [Vibrio crassostreae]CAK2439540.1 restriction system protein [Vibrio crassostreae]CAK2824648.1 restriction system protein [Vibrio crassostreae]